VGRPPSIGLGLRPFRFLGRHWPLPCLGWDSLNYSVIGKLVLES
jgi:hypothetical protein